MLGHILIHARAREVRVCRRSCGFDSRGRVHIGLAFEKELITLIEFLGGEVRDPLFVEVAPKIRPGVSHEQRRRDRDQARNRRPAAPPPQFSAARARALYVHWAADTSGARLRQMKHGTSWGRAATKLSVH